MSSLEGENGLIGTNFQEWFTKLAISVHENVNSRICQLMGINYIMRFGSPNLHVSVVGGY